MVFKKQNYQKTASSYSILLLFIQNQYFYQ